MLFNSLEFLIFFPIVLVIYFIIPKKIKYLWLLVASYYFYMCWNAKYALLMLFSTACTYAGGLLIEFVKKRNWTDKKKTVVKKLGVGFVIVSNLAVLCYFKYSNFFIDSLRSAFELINIELNIPSVDVLLPVGISFYTFQALSYTIDVYRDEIYAEKNFFRYALFVSFFPQLVAGPIERSKNLLKQLAVPKKFSYVKARDGLFLMVWGFFLKIVLADRIALLVDTVYGDYQRFGGWYIALATVLFAIQIYCDFYGYSTIAMGAAGMLGIDLMENFDAPYLSVTVAEFWRKWHISLTSWFKDYLYIPLGGSRKGVVRKYLNKIIVFLVSGLWHGANFTFVIWGALNGVYQVVGEILMPIREKICKVLHISRKFFLLRFIQMMITFVLVDFSWIFFRANTVEDSFAMIKSLFSADNFSIFKDGGIYMCGLGEKDFKLMLICIVILLIADIFKHFGISVRYYIQKAPYIVRCLVLIIAICSILVFGIWGSGYDAANFIYFQF